MNYIHTDIKQRKRKEYNFMKFTHLFMTFMHTIISFIHPFTSVRQLTIEIEILGKKKNNGKRIVAGDKKPKSWQLSIAKNKHSCHS